MNLELRLIRLAGIVAILLAVRSRCVVVGDCWVFLGARQSRGYASIRVGRVTALAHRALYEALHGPIPPGYEIDHTCEVRPCLNPAHHDCVPKKVNNDRRLERARARRHEQRQQLELLDQRGEPRCPPT